METLRLLSWNVAGRLQRLPGQVAAIAEQNPDVVALQEVRPSTAAALSSSLRDLGLPHTLETASEALAAGRVYGLLLASRWPLIRLPSMAIPYTERVLSVVAITPWGEVEIHVAHVPPGSGNGWKKIETFEGIFSALAVPSTRHRILCGDFNSPRQETPDGRLITWGQRTRPDGTVEIVRPGHERWDAGERNVLEGLRAFDLLDVFRTVHGYVVDAWSWRFLGKGRQTGRRFDHILASRRLGPVACTYLHAPREQRLSDHAAILAVFAPEQARDISATLPPETPPLTGLRDDRQVVKLGRRRVARRIDEEQSSTPARPLTPQLPTDVRSSNPSRDRRRRAQFHVGWRKAISGVVYRPETLHRLTWHNMGYRLGIIFGMTDPAQINELYDWCVRQQASAGAGPSD